jgi:hypothetical protein
MLTRSHHAPRQGGRELRLVSAPQFVPFVAFHKARFWIETIDLAGAIACALALLIATLGAVAAAASNPESTRTEPPTPSGTQIYEGMVTDTHCGARHSAAMGKTATDCTIICVRAGEQFVLIDGDTRYVLEGDRVTLKQVAGQRARIIGTLNGKTISVEAVMTLSAGT